MKKRKTYEISVIDKTYSKTISDETKFYTSDTALELVFKLKETEYNFESAEIVLLNIDDRSLVTRPVSKVNNDFVYELDDDIIPHYGEWHTQLRFEARETYVSSPVKFRIENDLSNDRPPQLSDVQSWVNLKRYADGLVDELKQAVEEAVANVEAMDDTFKANELDRDKAERERQVRFEDAESEREKGESVRVETFQTNETNRQSQFETAEQSRQMTFETNESERDRTFESNETTRQIQELERETAEVTRQQAEGQRQSTFEVNESKRQTTFETAEQERQSAELTRVENEEERVLNYENMQETIDMIDKVKLVNDINVSITANGDREITKTPELNQADDNITKYLKNNIVTGDKYYISIEVKSKGESGLMYFYSAGDSGLHHVNGVTTDEYQLKSKIVTGASKFALVRLVNITVQPQATGIVYKNVYTINLTKAFGEGNEPTKEVMDWIIKENGYFDYLTLNRDDIQQYEINQLRKAIIALGGTI